MKPKILTNSELNKINKRIDEIGSLFDLCDPDRDEDIFESLQSELEQLISILEVSCFHAQIKESGFKIIRGAL